MTQKWKTNQTTSKIYKLYINGKPKRPGTQQYPYLGPKIAVVAEKLDPIVDQLCFRCIFQTVRNLRKGTTEMSSEGPKMVRGRYGSAWNGRKTPKSDHPKVAAVAAFAGLIRERSGVAGWEILSGRSPHRAPPP